MGGCASKPRGFDFRCDKAQCKSSKNREAYVPVPQEKPDGAEIKQEVSPTEAPEPKDVGETPASAKPEPEESKVGADEENSKVEDGPVSGVKSEKVEAAEKLAKEAHQEAVEVAKVTAASAITAPTA